MNDILFLSTLILFNMKVPTHVSSAEVAEPGQYNALTLIRSYDLKTARYKYRLPFGAKNINNNDILFALNEGEHEVHFCPIGEQEGDLELGQKYFEEDLTGPFCLFSKQFMRGETKTCHKEPEPLVERSTRPGKPLQCGVEIPNTPEYRTETVNEIITNIPQNRLMYQFQFKICGSSDTLKEWIKTYKKISDAAVAPIYYICYDHKEKIPVYTEHEIWTSSLFVTRGLENQREYQSKQLDTSVFSYFENRQFLDLQNAYENQKNVVFRMVPHPMVPKQHMALGLWKKTTQHYLNTASLWERLVPLMDFIDTRILQMAVQENQKLLIYTTAFSFKWTTIQDMYLDKGKQYKVPNTWCKVVYYATKDQNLAIAIFVHNTPANPTSPSSYLCDEPYPCDFSKWIKPPNKLPGNVSDYIKYAYCCKVTKYVQDQFPIQLKLHNVLKLHKDFSTATQRLDDLRPKEDSSDESI